MDMVEGWGNTTYTKPILGYLFPKQSLAYKACLAYIAVSLVLILSCHSMMGHLSTIVTVLVTCSLCLANKTKDWQQREVPCHSLNFSTQFENIINHTGIFFADCEYGKNFELTSDIFVLEVNDLEIKGNQTAIINCTKTNVVISFEKVNNLHLENLHILNCGTINETALRTGSVNIVNCSNVTVKGVTIERSPSTGLTLVNNQGTVSVENSNFLSNGQVWRKLKRIIPLLLINNTFDTFHTRGGGVQVVVSTKENSSLTVITNSKFIDNTASHGGGLLLIIQHEGVGEGFSSFNTTIDQNDCHRESSELPIRFNIEDSTHIQYRVATRANSQIAIQGCTFFSNQAEYGGGVAIFSAIHSIAFPLTMLTFTNCQWTNNSAILGLAVDIAVTPRDNDIINGHLPTPVFTNCSFVENTDKSIVHSLYIVNKQRSVLYVSGFRIEFQKKTVFKGNFGSAIEATSSVLDFQANSDVFFIANQGIEGGALNLKASTIVYIHDNSSFLFESNTAFYRGGAIFVQFADKHFLFSSGSCFIQYVGTRPNKVKIKFVNNTIAVKNKKDPDQNISHVRCHGSTLWATSLFPCIDNTLSTEPAPISNAFKKIGNITLNGSLSGELRLSQFSTAANHFASTKISLENDSMCIIQVNDFNYTIRKNPNHNSSETNLIKETLHFIPGNIKEIPLRLVDDFCAEIFFMVRVCVITSEKHMYVHQAHSVITDNYITLYGDENQKGQIQLTTMGVDNIATTINVFMDECPPGFVHDHAMKACVCSANRDETKYRGIDTCIGSSAFVEHGFWVGYLDNTNSTKENSLAGSVCPRGFCSNNVKSEKEQKLPSTTRGDINTQICNANRTGLVCGECKTNYSVHYHSMSFWCKSNDLCHLGWLFYILSELIPVTLFFLVVIALNISFTSGPLNGVIFFMQFVDTLKIRAENFIWFEKPAYHFACIYKLVYRIFSLHFFALESLSFCLWSGASALDLLAFRYVTIIFSLLLIVGTTALLNICSFKFCNKYVINKKGYIIHGLSAFLVMSYSECTRISLMIISWGVFKVGPKHHLKKSLFVFYNGVYAYFGPEHLKYALPAIFFIITMVSIPPLLLISYPLCYKVFALLRLEESKCVYYTCKILPLEKIKPLFDSIQGAFKDRYRFFAGLYFVYRVSSLVTFSATSTLTTHYTATGFQLVFMLLIHAVCRPYKKSWHNVLDAFLFFNLFFVNGLSYVNYYLSTRKSVDGYQESDIQIVAFFQIGLILLPFVYLILYTTYCIILKLKAARVCRKHSVSRRRLNTNDSNAGHILCALDSRSIDESYEEASGYKLLKDSHDLKQNQ